MNWWLILEFLEFIGWGIVITIWVIIFVVIVRSLVAKHYRRQLNEYYTELNKLKQARKEREENSTVEEVSISFIPIISDTFEDLDGAEARLKKKYKAALAWQGPLFTGIVSNVRGYDIRVHSDDHGQHFHVIHRGKGIDARFSFPDMQLMDYKSKKNTISSKDEKTIREMCLTPKVYAALQEEFKKRPKKD